jgi:hypothetical protein
MVKFSVTALGVAGLLLVASVSGAGTAQEVPRQPEGFRFANGYLLPWGASKGELVAHLPRQRDTDLEEHARKGYSQCLETVAKLRSSDDLCKAFNHGERYFRVVFCSNQDLSAGRDPENAYAPIAKQVIEKFAADDGCEVSGLAMPKHYRNAALLAFNHDRFYRISVTIMHDP